MQQRESCNFLELIMLVASTPDKSFYYYYYLMLSLYSSSRHQQISLHTQQLINDLQLRMGPNQLLLRSLYRQCLRKSHRIIEHYGGPASLYAAHRAIFGLKLIADLPVNNVYPTTGVQMIRMLFHRPLSPQETVSERISAAFDALQKMEGALPNAEVDKKYFSGVAELKFGTGTIPPWIKQLGDFKPRVVLPAENAGAFPLDRHSIPSEPFYPVFLSTPWTRFPFLVPFLHQAVSPHVPVNFTFNNLDNKVLMEHLPTCTTTTTHGIEIECRTEYAGVESTPLDAVPQTSSGSTVGGKPSHVFRYVVAIRNLHPSRQPGSATVSLCSRHWLFVDVDKRHHMEVVGPGVVGEFPLLEPGDRHVYQSGVSLHSPTGVMTGTFQFIITTRGNGEEQSAPRQVDMRIAPTALRASTEESE